MSYLSKHEIEILFFAREGRLSDSDSEKDKAIDAVAWAYFIAREAHDEAQRGAADATTAKSDYDAESANEEPSEDIRTKAFDGTMRADHALYVAAGALHDATSALREHQEVYRSLAGFVHATAKYAYETADAARVANEAWEAIRYWQDDEDD